MQNQYPFKIHKKKNYNIPVDELYKTSEAQLEDLVVLTSERIPEIWIEAIEWILTKILDFVPWIENWKVLISARECQLYSKAAIYRASMVLAAGWADSTILIVKADKIRVSWTFRTTIPFPVQVLQPALLKLKRLHLTKSCQSSQKFTSKIEMIIKQILKSLLQE